MLRKSRWNQELVIKILNNYKINESIFIQPLIQYMIKREKSDFEIRMKLREKWFDEKIFQQLLLEERKSNKTKLNPKIIHIKINKLLRKWKSKQSIESEIKYKFNLTKEQVNEYLINYDFDNNSSWNAKLVREIKNLHKKWKNEFDIIRICLSKKFDYNKIKEALKNK